MHTLKNIDLNYRTRIQELNRLNAAISSDLKRIGILLDTVSTLTEENAEIRLQITAWMTRALHAESELFKYTKL